jgi:putative addiction module component (TIGR02574 family)
MNALLSELLDLEVTEKLELLEALWDSVAATPEAVPVTDWQKEELSARKRAYREGSDAGVTWDEVKERITRGGG